MKTRTKKQDAEQINKVYVLWHVHEIYDQDETKLLGIYSSRQSARAAVRRLRNKPGFVDLPKGFEIVAYDIDTDHWTEGFITVTYFENEKRQKLIKQREALIQAAGSWKIGDHPELAQGAVTWVAKIRGRKG